MQLDQLEEKLRSHINKSELSDKCKDTWIKVNQMNESKESPKSPFNIII